MTTQTFFAELKKLIALRAKSELFGNFSENISNSNYIYDSKNLSFCFDTAGSQDSMYLFDSFMCVDSMDCDYAVENESGYEITDGFKCYNCEYIENCDQMRDCSYCHDCSNLENCFGCTNIKNKSFCLFNRQLTEDQYRLEVKKYKALPAEKILTYLEVLKNKYPRRPIISDHSTNSPYGNYIFYSKNCYMCFDAAHDEDCAYLYDSFYNKFSFDLTYSSRYNEYCYQLIESARLNNCAYTVECNTGQDSAYLFHCNSVKNCFGCVGLQYKEYCILNRQFTKEEYEKLIPQLQKEVFESGMGWSDLIY